VDELDLHGQLTPQQMLADREEALDEMFPTAQLMPGAGTLRMLTTLLGLLMGTRLIKGGSVPLPLPWPGKLLGP
jgi:hypothetical protein